MDAIKNAQITPEQRRKYHTQMLLGGAAAGVAITSALNLVHAARIFAQDREELRSKNNPSENTIVLDIPHKVAATIEKPVSKKRTVVYKTQYRKDGKFDRGLAKQALETLNPSPGDVAIGLALMLTGGIGGYHLGNYIYNQYRKKEYEKQLSSAHKEYLDKLLANVEKTAEFVDRVLEFDKLAQENVYRSSIINKSVGLYLFMLLAAIGGSGFLTKRMLDSQAQRLYGDVKTWDPPKINRIIFKTQPNPQSSNVASPKKEQPIIVTDTNEEEDAHNKGLVEKAALALVLDQISGNPCLADDVELQKLAEAKNVDLRKLIKLAQAEKTPVSDYRSILENYPDVSAAIIDASFKRHIPLVGGMLSWVTPGVIKSKLGNMMAKRMLQDTDVNIDNPKLRKYLFSREYLKNKWRTRRDPIEYVTAKLDEDPKFRDLFLRAMYKKQVPGGKLLAGLSHVPLVGYMQDSVGKELAKVELRNKFRKNKLSATPKSHGYVSSGLVNLRGIDADIPGGLKKTSQLMEFTLFPPDNAKNNDKNEDNESESKRLLRRVHIMASDPRAAKFVTKNRQAIVNALSAAIEDVLIKSKADMKRV